MPALHLVKDGYEEVAAAIHHRAKDCRHRYGICVYWLPDDSVQLVSALKPRVRYADAYLIGTYTRRADLSVIRIEDDLIEAMRERAMGWAA